MSRLVLAIILLFSSLQADAQPQLQDYAFQASLGNSVQSLQRVELPVSVITVLARPDLGDLAVFNVNGKVLPHSVARIPESVEELAVDLPFHEFESFLRQSSRTVTTREQSLRDGSLSELETTESQPIRSVRRDYLVELTDDGEARAWQRIELDWAHEPATQLLDLRVEVGDDLDRLRVLRQRKTLALRDSDDETWRSIGDIPGGNKYLRLTPQAGIDSFTLHRVTGFYRRTQPAPQLVHTIDAERIEDEDGIFYRIEVPSAVVPEAMRILPRDADSVVAGDLYVGTDEPGSKRLVRRGFRQHNIDEEQVRPSPPLSLPRRSFGSIWFSSETELPAAPRVELIYPGYEIFFLGDGNGPYDFAWGNHASEERPVELSALLEGGLEEARKNGLRVEMGAVREAGGVARLAPQAALPWQKWLLWILLLAAALVTGRMAWRLYREMNHADPA